MLIKIILTKITVITTTQTTTIILLKRATIMKIVNDNKY